MPGDLRSVDFVGANSASRSLDPFFTTVVQVDPVNTEANPSDNRPRQADPLI
jgi:hypothetical protein